MSDELGHTCLALGIDPPLPHLLLGLPWCQSRSKGRLIKRRSGTARSTDRRTSPIRQSRCFPAAHRRLATARIPLKHWKTLLCLFQKWASADLNGKFKLPMKNEFIPTNFEIYPLEKESPSVPTIIKASAALTTWLFISAPFLIDLPCASSRTPPWARCGSSRTTSSSCPKRVWTLSSSGQSDKKERNLDAIGAKLVGSWLRNLGWAASHCLFSYYCYFDGCWLVSIEIEMLINRQDAANQITSVSGSVKPGIFGRVLIWNGHLLIYFLEKDASDQEIVEF